MKSICLTLLFGLSVSFMSGQTRKNVVSETNQCVMHYNDNKWTTVHCGDTTDHQCEELVIGKLPPMSQKSIPIVLDIDYKGDYSIQKDQLLQIPEEYRVLLKDVVTGEYYNLDSSEPCVFSLKKSSHRSRFVMEIDYNREHKLVGYLFKGRNNHLF